MFDWVKHSGLSSTWTERERGERKKKKKKNFQGPDFHKELHLQKVNADKFVNINLSMSKEARARVSKKGNPEIFIF